MADKRITDVDFLDSLNGNESFFVNQNNSLKQINKNDIVFGIEQGGTGATNLEDARANLGIVPENIGAAEKVHTHSASDITSGTISKDILPALSASDFDAAPSSHTHTAEEIGASPSSHTHTAEEIGASPSSHTHTASEVGALSSSGGTVSGELKVSGNLKIDSNGDLILQGSDVVLKEGTNYGTEAQRPTAGVKGRIFFKKV